MSELRPAGAPIGVFAEAAGKGAADCPAGLPPSSGPQVILVIAGVLVVFGIMGTAVLILGTPIATATFTPLRREA